MNTDVPVPFAKRTSAAVHSRSWVTAPALAATAADCTVWIESITSSAALRSPASWAMASRSLAATTVSWPVPRPSRRARSATWPTDSSPLAYSTGCD
jgi:hypothetical protein